MRVPQRRGETQRHLLKTDDHHLTPAAIQRMKDEIVRLTKTRPPLVEEMQEAATQGDFSENAGYQAAKQALRRLNDRITSLEQRIAYAIPITNTVDGRIRIGSTVTVEAAGKNMTFEIVGSQESSPSRGRISHVSPLGVALLNHVVGDTVAITIGDRQAEFRVTKVA